MKLKHQIAASIAGLSTAVAGGASAQSIDFGAFELLNFGESSEVFAISGDGSAAVGQSDTSGPREAVIWFSDGSILQIPSLASDSRGLGVSFDGSTVVGVSSIEAFLWSSSSGTIGLGDFSGGLFNSAANDVSGDGQIVVGFGTTAIGIQAFRWTQATGLAALGDLPGGAENSSALGISTDGNVIVGFSASTNGPEAFRWTAQEGLVGLGDLPGGIFSSAAQATSADGSIIVGAGFTDNGIEAFRWEVATGIIGLGTLPGGFLSLAYDISEDGSVIVGSSDDALGREAVRWTQGGGIERIEALLTDSGISLGTWQLTDALGVSGDGSVIVGNGISPDGFNRAWFARIGVGFITPSVIASSLQSVSAVPYSIERIALADVDNALQSARAYGRASARREPGAVGIWGAYHGDWHDAVVDRRLIRCCRCRLSAFGRSDFRRGRTMGRT
jgi:probable HAF family extracellular repeat protein